MGRKDAVQVILEVVARCKQILPALRVDYEAGWQTRGNGTSANYEGGTVHHTAFVASLVIPYPARNTLIGGRTGLPGPLCNFAGPYCTAEAPVLTVVAAHPANHAGASGGPSMGPLPVTSLFNPRVLGLEIDYGGFTPMSAGQLLVSQAWARAVAEVVGGNDIERVRAHAETSITGKWDPGVGNGKSQTLNMAEFRRGAHQITTAAAAALTLPESSVSVRIAVTPDKTCWFLTDTSVEATNSIYSVGAVAKAWGTSVVSLTREELQDNINLAARNAARLVALFSKAIPTVPNLNAEDVVDGIVAELQTRAETATPLTAEQFQEMLDSSEIDTVNLIAARFAA